MSLDTLYVTCHLIEPKEWESTVLDLVKSNDVMLARIAFSKCAYRVKNVEAKASKVATQTIEDKRYSTAHELTLSDMKPGGPMRNMREKPGYFLLEG
jgi:hypothetical protein